MRFLPGVNARGSSQEPAETTSRRDLHALAAGAPAHRPLDPRPSVRRSLVRSSAVSTVIMLCPAAPHGWWLLPVVLLVAPPPRSW
ncbi:hypothetical protein OG698_08565 [Streptomyces sp. NBC_01003]|uniref:hypothetical protein n=1 Tax=Streptomyces sp. NBC_01003 TaxID=2903714 RepID=UPI0038652DB1|nr:hypothetical protein OG698_08565 [Streptomyces sp. NBC_01003]